MPFSPSSCARLAEKLAIAAFVAANGARAGVGRAEFRDELPMIDEPGPMCGSSNSAGIWITCTSGRDEVTVGPLSTEEMGVSFAEVSTAVCPPWWHSRVTPALRV